MTTKMTIQVYASSFLLLRSNAFFFSRATSKNNQRQRCSSSTTRNKMSCSDAQQHFVEDVLPRAWSAIGLKEIICDEPFREMFRDTLKEFGDGVSKEVEFNAAMMEGGGLPLETALERYELHRTPSAGVTPCMAFACLFKPLSTPDVYQDHTFRELLRVASLISGVDNDLQSQNKEGEWDRVSILMRLGGYSRNDAIEATCCRHEELIEKYNQIATKLFHMPCLLTLNHQFHYR